MSTITIEIIDHLVLLALIAFVPWNGHRRFTALTKGVNAGDLNARTRFYRGVLLSKWNLTGVVAAAWIALNRSAESIGLIAEFDGFTPLALAGYTLTALAIGGLLIYAQSVPRNGQLRARTREAIAHVRALLPHTATEKRWFNCVSVFAGISEEFIYRGYLFAYLAVLIPGMPTGVVVIIAGLIFGLGHAYQGPAGIVKTGALGVVFGVLYWMTGSLLAPMLLHASIDLITGWINWQIIHEDDPADAAVPVPA